MEQKIKTIEKGWGEGSTYFTTDEKRKGFPVYVREIKEEIKHVGAGLYCDLTRVVYRGYLESDTDFVFEIESGSELTLTFESV